MNNSICQGCGVCMLCGRSKPPLYYTYGLSGGVGSLDGKQTVEEQKADQKNQSYCQHPEAQTEGLQTQSKVQSLKDSLLKNKLKDYLIEEYKRILRIDVNCRSLQTIYDAYRNLICNEEYSKELLDAFDGLREEAYKEEKKKEK